jgi:hypothetical protein
MYLGNGISKKKDEYKLYYYIIQKAHLNGITDNEIIWLMGSN